MHSDNITVPIKALSIVTNTVHETESVKGKAIPVQALRVLGSSGSQISSQSAHEGGNVISPTP